MYIHFHVQVALPAPITIAITQESSDVSLCSAIQLEELHVFLSSLAKPGDKTPTLRGATMAYTSDVRMAANVCIIVSGNITSVNAEWLLVCTKFLENPPII
jgi:hypothetical protein